MRFISRPLAIQKIKIIIILACFFSFIFFSCENLTGNKDKDSKYQYTVPTQTDDGWETTSLSKVGMKEATISDMMILLRSRDDHYIHSVLIIKDGKLVLEEYFSGQDMDVTRGLQQVKKDFDRNTLHFQASVTKSFTSAVLGIAKNQGLFQNVEQKIFPFFPEFSKYSDEVKDQITIAHCLSMCSGFPWDESSYSYNDNRNDVFQFLYNMTPFEFLLSRPLYTTPGKKFLYNSGDSNVLGEIVTRTSDEYLLNEFAGEYLFKPLGIKSYQWMRLPFADQVTFASGGLYLLPRDMAKFGQLYLNEGEWKGKRIISADWIRESVKESIYLPSSWGRTYAYGYQWWLEKYRNGALKAYSARGWGNQFIVVIPAVKLVVVFTGGAYYNSVDNSQLQYDSLVERYILGSI